MTNNTIRLVLADDQNLFLEGLKLLLKDPQIAIVGTATNGIDLIRTVQATDPDIILTDIKMPTLDGIQATRKITQLHPHIGIIALSMFEESSLIVDIFKAGAKGYLSKNTSKSTALSAIRTVYNGGYFFPKDISDKLLSGIAVQNSLKETDQPFITEKERLVLELICQQYSSKEIAEKLNVSNRSVESTRERLQKKTMTRNAVGLALYALKKGLIK